MARPRSTAPRRHLETLAEAGDHHFFELVAAGGGCFLGNRQGGCSKTQRENARAGRSNASTHLQLLRSLSSQGRIDTEEMFDLVADEHDRAAWRAAFRSEIPLTGHCQRMESGLTSGLLVECAKPVNAVL